MRRKTPMWTVLSSSALALLLGATAPPSRAQEEFGEAKAIVEINATDGDAGFHVLLDADAWKSVRMEDPDGERIFKVGAKGRLREQGLTENFFESAEPLCAFDPDDPEAEVVPLAEFLDRFPAGEYRLTGTTIEGDALEGTAELTHDLPAAPVDLTFDGAAITWAAGSDLGENCHDDDLVLQGIIPDPGLVVVVGWEVVLEPEDDEAVSPNRVFKVQLPGDGPMSVTVPPEYLETLIDDGVTEFKFEVGAIEESGNQTFSEATFEIESP